jgi:hypothetical protein
MPNNEPPKLAGIWKIKGYYIEYRDRKHQNVNLKNPKIFPESKIKIKQNGRFFTYKHIDGRHRDIPKIGVMEKIYLDGKFIGWKGHVVNTKFTNSRFHFNFSKMSDNNRVDKFEITYDKAGFSPCANSKKINQHPQVEYIYGKRIK